MLLKSFFEFLGTQHWFFKCMLCIAAVTLQAQSLDSTDQALKKLSMEELMDIEVTTVSKRPEKLSEVASAIQVITSDEIRRSGATNVPEALRLIPNVQVAQVNSYAWMISVRGFNAVFGNKLLVMIDGRTVYTPLFAGVYWDIQNVMLEDVDRIEVVSGPGGTIWGVNAVNGVINIITKNAQQTKGICVSGTTGNFIPNLGAVRVGAGLGNNAAIRAYVQHFDRNNTFLANGQNNTDRWNITQGGVQFNWKTSSNSHLDLQANAYEGEEHTVPEKSTLNGQNILAKWGYTFSNTSEIFVQAYADRTWRRDVPSTITDELRTYDVDLQYRTRLRTRHFLMAGLGYRSVYDETQNSTFFVGFVPKNRIMDLYSCFLQDEISLLADRRLRLILGTKLQHNVFTSFELQPSARMVFLPTHRHTLWTAVSRAVRAPSRIDVDYYLPTIPMPAFVPTVQGGPNFKSEKVIAYELGYRMQPSKHTLFSLGLFYNQYQDLYSVEALPRTVTYQIQNGTQGTSWGLELAATSQISRFWKLRGGYTFFNKDIHSKPGHTFDPSYLGNDPKHTALLHSMIDLPANFQLDVIGRYVDSLPATTATPHVPDYFDVDLRIGWKEEHVEISLVGQHLLRERHTQIGTNQIPRSYYVKIVWKFLQR